MSGLKGITMNTDPTAQAHIYAEDDAAIYQSIVGVDGVFDIGQKCAATILSNNKVRVADGVVCVGGHFARIPYGDYADCTIANGQSGYKRNDIIVAKIVSTGIGGIDTMTCEVKQGAAGSTASDPAITQGNVYEGALIREFPLYRVRIEGLSIVGVDQLFKVVQTLPKAQERIGELETEVDALNSNINEIIYNGVVNNGQVAAYRRGNVVTLVFNAATVISDVIGWQTIICTLPNKYVPNYGFYFGGTDGKTFYMNSNGSILCTSAVSKNEKLFAIVTYVVND